MLLFRFRPDPIIVVWLLTLLIGAASAFFLMHSPTPACAGQEDGRVAPAPSSDYKKTALLTVFYNASTHGELHPCPT